MLSKDTEFRLDHAVTDEKIGDEISARLISSTPADAAEAQAILDILDVSKNKEISSRLFTALSGDGNGAAGKEIAQKINGMVAVLEAQANGDEVAAVAEVTSVTPVAAVGGSLDGTYFILQDKDGSVAFWIDIDDSGTAEPAHGADRSVEITTIATGDSAAVIAGKLITAIGADSEYSAAAGVGDEVLVTDGTAGDRPAASAGDSGFTVSQDTDGSDGVDTDISPAKAAMGSESMSASAKYSLVHALGSQAAADEFETAYNAMVSAVQAI